QKINARPGNFGSRIDFVLVCESMQTWVKDANTQEGLFGSDHCPVYVDFHDKVQSHGKEVGLIDEMSPPGVFQDGVRMKEWKVLDVPAFSGKRLPEFDKRRSIKSMFAAPSLTKPSSNAPDSYAKPSAPVKQEAVAAPVSHDSPRFTSTAPESNGSTNPPALKRKASVSAKPKPSKRQKSEPAAPASKGQQSLKGFFSKGKASATGKTLHDAGSTNNTHGLRALTNQHLRHQRTRPSTATAPPSTTASPGSQLPSPSSAFTASPSTFSARAASIEQSQKSWSTLFSRPIAPLCEGHSEPCKTMQTKKKGSNQGRSFWMCARPLGPSGGKEKGTQWRCATFIWGSDWQGKRGEGGVGEGGGV
ncbi:hypothetical protein B0A55_13566, partial [Friedmanniomyces simplex]